jgi:hypothetical protein
MGWPAGVFSSIVFEVLGLSFSLERIAGNPVTGLSVRGVQVYEAQTSSNKAHQFKYSHAVQHHQFIVSLIENT